MSDHHYNDVLVIVDAVGGGPDGIGQRLCSAADQLIMAGIVPDMIWSIGVVPGMVLLLYWYGMVPLVPEVSCG